MIVKEIETEENKKIFNKEKEKTLISCHKNTLY